MTAQLKWLLDAGVIGNEEFNSLKANYFSDKRSRNCHN